MGFLCFYLLHLVTLPSSEVKRTGQQLFAPLYRGGTGRILDLRKALLLIHLLILHRVLWLRLKPGLFIGSNSETLVHISSFPFGVGLALEALEKPCESNTLNKIKRVGGELKERSGRQEDI